MVTLRLTVMVGLVPRGSSVWAEITPERDRTDHSLSGREHQRKGGMGV